RAARKAAGLDPDSLAFGAYVNVAPHPDVAIARELVRGGVGTMAHFSGMRGSSADGVAPADRAVFEGIHARYEREKHTLGAAGAAESLCRATAGGRRRGRDEADRDGRVVRRGSRRSRAIADPVRAGSPAVAARALRPARSLG